MTGLDAPTRDARPTGRDRARWAAADRAARKKRLDRVRAHLAAAGLDAYFGIRPENSRYLTGFALGDGEDRVAGSSGQFIVGRDETILFADSRYAEQAEREAAGCRIEPVYGDLVERWPTLVGSVGGGVRRVGVEAAFVSHALWADLAAAAPSVELVPVSGWIEADRATKEPAEIERIGAACRIVDRALDDVVSTVVPGRTERDVALQLEWAIRTGGADGLAFDIACLSGSEAALPHGSPRDRPIETGAVLLVDVGASVDGYRSDMTRTLFVGKRSARDAALYDIVAEAQAAAIEALEAAVRLDVPISGRQVDATARAVIEAAGHGERFGHGTGHGIGLATHEAPTLGRRASDDPLPDPTVFSVEPGIYLPGVTGIRIEDLVHLNRRHRVVEMLTAFPRTVVEIG